MEMKKSVRLDDEYEGAGNYGILKLKREINKESKDVLLKTENYTFAASNQCNDTSFEYPTQYSCSLHLGKYNMKTNIVITRQLCS
jgi:hypothetical protein